VEIVDLRIIYQKGAPIAYIRPATIQGPPPLAMESSQVSVLRIEPIVDAEQLLLLIRGMDAHGLAIHWQS
jgi:hypothetical protein